MRLGIDIGGTTIGIGRIDDSGLLLDSSFHDSFPKDASLEKTLEFLKSLIGSCFSQDVAGIGLGIPSALDRQTGLVYNAINIPSWKNVPLKAILEDHFGVPVRINNDSNCFALGAYAHFKEENPASMAGITLGTGVGMGLVINGELYNGNNTGAGEIGCISYLDADLETYCSSHFFSAHGLTCKQAAEAMERGDSDAKKLFDEFGMHLARLMAVVLYAYDPEMVVFGGGISRAFPYFKASMMEHLRKGFIYPASLDKLKIRQLVCDDTALLGAANLES